jgi:serine/threonine-protein phosphatase 2A regulatory subunit B'
MGPLLIEVITDLLPPPPGSAEATGADGAPSARQRINLFLLAQSVEEQESWLSALAVACVPDTWPGGLHLLTHRPEPLLYSLWAAKAGKKPRAGSAASKSVGNPLGSGGGANEPGASASPFTVLPLLKSAPAWQRKALFLAKLRVCAVVFDGLTADAFPEDWETKRNTLLEVVDFVDSSMASLSDPMLLEDTFTMIRCNIFRTLPEAAAASGDPDGEQRAFEDALWPHLNIVYELLMRLVSADQIDLALKKKVVDPAFVKQLLDLFDSEDTRERDFLKAVTHRIYTRITQRRAHIRRVICNLFSEFVLETERHCGIGELLEILASIINGFAVPIKQAHKQMLLRHIVPLHKAKTLDTFLPQLAYCVALFLSREHELSREVLPALLRLWPVGNTAKQVLLLNELEDMLEYTREDDMTAIRGPLAVRLAKCLSSQHFQIAERSLLLWNSERFAALLVYSPQHRAAVLPVVFPALYANQTSHWHESIRNISLRILEQYGEIDPELTESCLQDFEAKERRAEAEAEGENGTAPNSPSLHGFPLAAAGPDGVFGSQSSAQEQAALSMPASPGSIFSLTESHSGENDPFAFSVAEQFVNSAPAGTPNFAKPSSSSSSSSGKSFASATSAAATGIGIIASSSASSSSSVLSSPASATIPPGSPKIAGIPGSPKMGGMPGSPKIAGMGGSLEGGLLHSPHHHHHHLHKGPPAVRATAAFTVSPAADGVLPGVPSPVFKLVGSTLQQHPHLLAPPSTEIGE